MVRLGFMVLSFSGHQWRFMTGFRILNGTSSSHPHIFLCMPKRPAFRNPWVFIPTLYFAEGVPYILINAVSVILYKRMGIDNVTIAFWTSFLYLPWVVKMFWGPVVDTHATKRSWVISTQLFMTGCLAVVAVALQFPGFFFLSLTALFVGAFISATHDIAADGFYLLALDKENQSLFVGIRSTFYRLAMIFGQGFIVWLAGELETSTGNTPLSWTFAFSVGAVVFFFLFLYHRVLLPDPEGAGTPVERGPRHANAFVDVFSSYFAQEKIGIILAFILLYRFGEAFLVKMAPPFFLDKPEVGGLGFSTAEVGIVYGTIGVVSLLAGGVIGGIVIKKFGLRKCLWPMAVIINLPMYVYVFLSTVRPGILVTAPFIALEQFSYGFGFAAYLVYLMYASRGRYKTSHYAISTGLMALGMMFPGLVSGYLQKLLGYHHFFILTAILGIPGLVTLFFVPLPDEEAQPPKA
jgi:PAT family beta-lactamase induction signal transducer AmpG